jgi:hypothetical protein
MMYGLNSSYDISPSLLISDSAKTAFPGIATKTLAGRVVDPYAIN